MASRDQVLPEDLQNHRLGEDFQNAKAMNLGQVIRELNAQVRRDEEKGEGKTSTTAVFQKCLGYSQKFVLTGMTNDVTLDKVKDLVNKPEYSLTEFEKAALVNLLPGSAEEAKVLIPSLTVERVRLVPGDGDESPMMVPDDSAITGLLRDLEIFMNT